ncbi:MAG: VOC family protein, partial [Ktedonobacteraceae bacterium]
MSRKESIIHIALNLTALTVGAVKVHFASFGCSDGGVSLAQWRSDMTTPAKNTVCLWYDGNAEDAARFYANTFPDSFVGA